MTSHTNGFDRVSKRSSRFLLRASGYLAALLLTALVAPPSPALAAPVHPPLTGSDFTGLNHACGVATDSKGDVYVASAGGSEVKVFDPAHIEVASIANVNEPCGLAVDSKGNLYVSEKGTGNVVKYVPNAYPFTGTLTYSAVVPIDSSGNAEGIAVDPADDRLFVAVGTSIATYDAGGVSGPSIGIGELTEATGVAAYTYAGTGHQRYVTVADAEGDLLKIFSGRELTELKLRRTIEGVDHDANPATAEQEFGFGSAGAYLSAEAGSGHFFLYDDAHSVVDELDASGQFVTQVINPGFSDAQPTAIAAFPQRNEVQHLQTRASSGSFTLSFEGQTTPSVPLNANAEQLQGALEALSTIGADNVSVHGEYNLGTAEGSYSIAFVEALGEREVSQLGADGSGLSGGEHRASVVTETPGSGPGRLYVSTGAGAGAKALTFGALPAPGRPGPLAEPLSLKKAQTGDVAIDSKGDRYVSDGTAIYIYSPAGALLGKIEDPNSPGNVAVDSVGNVYTMLEYATKIGDERVVYFPPSAYPPGPGVTYGAPVTIATTADDFSPNSRPEKIAVNPANDRVFASDGGSVVEFASAKQGSAILNPTFGDPAGLPPEVGDIEVYGANGNVYLAGGSGGGGGGGIYIFDPEGKEVLTRITGVGSPGGALAAGSIAVDQSNGHAAYIGIPREIAEEYDASGTFVAEFGKFTNAARFGSDVAIDNSGGATDGNVYVAFDDTAPGSFDLTAFGPLAYGEPPLVQTGAASEVGAGSATLNGSVDPRGFALETCAFKYTSEEDFEDEGFNGADEAPCVPAPAAIGSGSGAVAVHAQISGLDPEGRYRFQLLAQNKYGPSEGKAGLFGPPILTAKPALPVAYTEATLRATVDPSGLATKYHFEYGSSETYGSSTQAVEIPANAGPTEVEVPIVGLIEGTAYHFRFVVENEAKTIEGPDQGFETLTQAEEQQCSNEEFRTGRSASLPDCRAYELVTPADTAGASPYAAGTPDSIEAAFNNWLTAPRGAAAGGRLTYFVDGTLPGFDGTGLLGDGYRAERAPGAHPSGGWANQIFSPSFAMNGGEAGSAQQGVAPDQLSSFWTIYPAGTTERYLRTPTGFEPIGQGSLGTDIKADGQFLSAGGAHVIFRSKAHLEEEAPAAGTMAIYERAAGSSNARVVSLLPGDVTPASDAQYINSSEDGASILFEVGGALYLRRDGVETVKVADAPNTFAGIAEDGSRVLYADVANGETPGELFAFDVATQSTTQIADEAIFVNVSADASYVYFTSEQVLDDAEEGTLGADNLYLWDGAGIRFIAVLDPQDLVSFEGLPQVDLGRWTSAIDSEGRGASPARSTPDGEVLVFQSHARLTAYDNDGLAEIYRYDVAADGLICISCDPSGAPAGEGAALQALVGAPVNRTTLIPSLTDDGQAIFFSSEDAILPEDANSVNDVYEWRAQGSNDCKAKAGCLALISSGQGDRGSFLYSMSADGHDVFFHTKEKLVGQDVLGSPSIYDARVEGGIPDPPVAEDCKGDACQGNGSVPPVLPTPGSAAGSANGNLVHETKPRCAKGKRQVRRGGKTRCVKRQKAKKQHKKQRANSNRRASR